jgi:2'-hydroxyisoflavone reductase
MRLLVLGCTRFIGYAIIEAALAAGWEVSAFNRGISGSPPPGAQTLRGDRTQTDDLARLPTVGSWDAVVDTSGFVPRDVLTACRVP